MMTALTRYEPLVTRLDDLFEDLFRPALGWTNGDYEPLPIRLDVKEAPEAYTVQAELPGVKKDDIHVEIDGGEVHIRAETQRETEANANEKWLRVERFFGRTERRFALPNEVDADKAQARFVDGILELTLPKKAAVSGRKLEIR
jgi:HSP20 family protein